MRTSLTPAQIQQYRRDGFLVYADLLSSTETAELAAGVARAVAALGKYKIANGPGWESGDSYYDQVFLQKLNLWKLDDVVKRYMLAPELGEMCATLEGVDGLRLYHDQTLQKQPWGNPTAWHLDNPYWPFYTTHAISIWIALEDATVQNGCLWYLPGSQRIVDYRNCGIGQDFAELFKVYPELASHEPVNAVMKAGSCGFHNGLTAHCAGVNLTPRNRPAMTAAYFDDGCTYNGQVGIMKPEKAAAMQVGDVLTDPEDFPLVWRAPVLV